MPKGKNNKKKNEAERALKTQMEQELVNIQKGITSDYQKFTPEKIKSLRIQYRDYHWYSGQLTKILEAIDANAINAYEVATMRDEGDIVVLSLSTPTPETSVKKTVAFFSDESSSVHTKHPSGETASQNAKENGDNPDPGCHLS